MLNNSYVYGAIAEVPLSIYPIRIMDIGQKVETGNRVQNKVKIVKKNSCAFIFTEDRDKAPEPLLNSVMA